MNLKTNLTIVFQKLIHWYYGFEHHKFLNSILNVKSEQLKQLEQILDYLAPFNKNAEKLVGAKASYEEFRRQVPITHYSDWKLFVEEVRSDSNHPFRKICKRFEPTSGSTNACKWIPYTDGFLSEINLAAAAWLSDTTRQYPGVLNGKHYWSLSWVPPELRQTHNSNDVDLFPKWQRLLLSHIMAVPDTIKRAKTQEACWFAALIYLISCEDLTLISIWSPTFLLQMIDDIYKHKKFIISSLQKGEWAAHSDELQNIPCPQSQKQAQVLTQLMPEGDRALVFKALWPKLSLISCWDSSTATTWVPEIKKIFPRVPLQGKGLWATEGVVSFPFQGKKILSLRSHFYEFRCLETNQIYPSWEIKKGMKVQPILSSKNGFLRYELPDMMIVTDFIKNTPCLEFVSRINSIDLVGEKIDFDLAHKLVIEISKKFGVRSLCLIAEKNTKTKPNYKLLIEGDPAEFINLQPKIEDYLEERLCNHYHYQLSRSLGQLNSSEVLVMSDTLSFLKQFHKSSIGGGNKIEPIVVLEHN